MLQKEKVRIFGCSASSFIGVILLVCFVLPSFRSCSVVSYPYQETNIFDFAEMKANTYDYLLNNWKYLLPYISGYLIALSYIFILWKKRDTYPNIRDMFALISFSAISVFAYVILRELATDAAFFYGPANPVNSFFMGCLILLFLMLPIYAFITLRKMSDFKKIAAYQATFGIIYLFVMAVDVVSFDALYGLKIAAACMVLLVILADIIYRSA